MVKNQSAMLKTWVPPPGQEDPLEKGILLNCGVGEDSRESLKQQADQTSQS